MEEKISILLELYKALADRSRLQILYLLRHSDYGICVNGIAARLGVSQSAVSQHLKILKHAGLVMADRKGNFIHYAASSEMLSELHILQQEIFSDVNSGEQGEKLC